MSTPVEVVGEMEPSSSPEPAEEVGFQSWFEQLEASIWQAPWRIWLVLLLSGLIAATFIFVSLTNVAFTTLAACFIAVSLLVARRAPQHRLVVAMLSSMVSMRYLYWRATETLSEGSLADELMGLALLGAELFTVIVLVAGYFQTGVIRRSRPVELDPTDTDLPTVDIFIPTYNEPVEVVRPTILGAMAVEYANKKVYVLDDGRRESFRAMCEELGVGYRIRSDNFHAKAGNINTALKTTDGELIAIFDADHVPVRSFLSATVGFMVRDERVALVQTPHHFYNPDPFARNLFLEGQVPPEQHLFYHGVQLGNDFWNSAFFCGSCAVIRRSALEEVGGIAVETVTEDAHTALRMHARGWKSTFLELPLAAGLATESFADHIGQRIRWARGMAQIFRLDNPLIKPGLNFAQRINYFNAAWHFFHGVPRLVFLISPATYLILDIHPVSANVREVLMYAIPHLMLAGIGTALTNRNIRHSFWPEIYEIAIAPYSAWVTTIALFAPRKGKFNVTDKGINFDRTSFSWRPVRPHIVMFVLALIGMILTPAKMAASPLEQDTIWVAVVWNAYNMFMLLAVMMAAVERPQRRQHHRIARTCAVSIPELAAEGESMDLSVSGFRVRLYGHLDCPERYTLTLHGPLGLVSLEGTHLRSRQDGEDTIIQGRFESLTKSEEQALSEVMFSGADSWMHDEFSFDSPMRSALSVLISPLVVLMGGPERLRRLTRLGAGVERLLGPAELGPLVPELAGPKGEALPTMLRPPKKGLLPMAGPAVLLVTALLLAAGFQPIVTMLSSFLPTQRWVGVPFQTRLSELGGAFVELSGFHRELQSARKLHDSLPVDWSSRLWATRRNFNLFGPTSADRNHADIEAALDEALLDMISAEQVLRDGGDDEILLTLIDSAEKNLQYAAERLGTSLP